MCASLIQTTRYSGTSGTMWGSFVAATSKNVQSMLESKKIQSRQERAFMDNVKAFDGSHVSVNKARPPKKKNYQLARKLMDNYSLLD